MTSTPGTVLITGTTSGVGLNAANALALRGWRVITANRSPQRAAAASDELGIPKERLQHVLMDLGDLDRSSFATEPVLRLEVGGGNTNTDNRRHNWTSIRTSVAAFASSRVAPRINNGCLNKSTT